MAMGLFSIGLMELLIVGAGGGLFGMPPGPRDAAYVQSAAAESLIYIEWAERSQGTPGAPGIDGFVADPEIDSFVADFEKALQSMIDTELQNASHEEQIVAKHTYPLVKSILNGSGCLAIGFDETKLQAATALAGPEAAIVGVQAALVVHPVDPDDAAEHIRELLNLLPPDLRTDNLDHQQFPLPVPGAQLFLHRHEDYFIVAFGEATLETVISGLSGDSPGLSTNSRFNQAMQAVLLDRTAGLGWIDLKGIIQTVSTVLGPQGAMVNAAVAMAGADTIDSVATCNGLIDGQFVSRIFVDTGGKTEGILSLAAGRAIGNADLNKIPADADLAVAFSINLSKVLTAARTIVGTADAQSLEAMNGMIGQLENELGMSIEDDLLEAIDDVWTIYDSPSAGGFFFTSLIAGVNVKDQTKAEQTFAKIVNLVEESVPGEFGGDYRRAVLLENREFKGRTIYYINTIGDDDVPVAPAFCLVEGQILVALHPQTIKAHLTFLDSGDTNFAAQRNRGLRESDGELICLTYFETRTLLRYITAIAPFVAQVIFSEAQQDGFEMDIFSLPSARAILPYFHNSVGTVTRTPNGLMSESRGGIPYLPSGFLGGMLLPLVYVGGISPFMMF